MLFSIKRVPLFDSIDTGSCRQKWSQMQHLCKVSFMIIATLIFSSQDYNEDKECYCGIVISKVNALDYERMHQLLEHYLAAFSNCYFCALPKWKGTRSQILWSHFGHIFSFFIIIFFILIRASFNSFNAPKCLLRHFQMQASNKSSQ